MNNNLIQIKVKERLNKLASFDYDNLECWQISEAFNKVQLEWVRRQINGINQKKEGDEGSKMLIDDLQILITEHNLNLVQDGIYFESESLPDNYLYYKRVSTNGKVSCCPDDRPLSVYLAEVANVDGLLKDNFKKPSAQWGETFCTLQNNKVRLYSNGEFDNFTSSKLHYYRKPVEIEFLNCKNPSTGAVATVDVECEFKDDIVEILIDETCAILAGDIESMVQIQRNKQNSITNT